MQWKIQALKRFHCLFCREVVCSLGLILSIHTQVLSRSDFYRFCNDGICIVDIKDNIVGTAPIQDEGEASLLVFV